MVETQEDAAGPVAVARSGLNASASSRDQDCDHETEDGGTLRRDSSMNSRK